LQILTTQNLTHIYSPATPFEHVGLDNISLSIEKGSITGIIGHTGSGKSTLVKHLNGLLKPTSGRVLLEGGDIWRNKKEIRDVRFRVGLVFQYPEYQLFEETVYKDIAFGPKNMGLDSGEIEQRVLDACDFVGIGRDYLQKSPFELSGGEKRRAAIAGVIAMRPDVLILDEPTAGLDPAGRDAILENIKNYHQAGERTVVLVTHSMEDMARIAGRLIVMAAGRVVMQGATGEIYARAGELSKIGLSVPQITSLCMRLAELGIDLGRPVYTVDTAVTLLSELFDKKRAGGIQL